MSRMRYTEEHLEFLRANYPLMRIRELTTAFNNRFGMEKSYMSIHSTLTNHRMTGGRKKRCYPAPFRAFTLEQKEFIDAAYKQMSLRELVGALNARFGTQKTANSLEAFIKNHGIHSGRTGRYEKGFQPWNAGTKGMGLTGANSRSFKKGNVPPNRKPLGTERLDKNDYIEVKVAETDPYTGFPTRYRKKHVVIWERVHGPVPAGHCVIFLDGKKEHCEIGNLACVTRSELARLNQIGYGELPADLKPSMLALVRLRVKAFDRAKEMRF